MVKEPQDTKAALKLYKAMYRFGGFAETRSMVEWLESELSRLDAANRSEEVDGVFRQRQGAGQVLEKILSMVAGSSDMVNKLEATIEKLNVRR
jgi:hypothetical protein